MLLYLGFYLATPALCIFIIVFINYINLNVKFFPISLLTLEHK